MQKLSLFLSIILSYSISCYPTLAIAELNNQDHDSFIAAIRTATSTVSEYVQIQLTNMNDHSTSTVCVTANLFMGAIHKEYELDYSKSGSSKANEIVISNKSHHFVFSNPDAFANMPFNHSPSDVALIQKLIADYTLEELKAGLGRYNSLYHEVESDPLIANHFHEKHRLVFNGAFACALINRGLRVSDAFGLRVLSE